MRRAQICTVVAVLATLALSTGASAISTTWSFDSDAQGWSQNQTELEANNSPATWHHVLFGTGGYISLTDTFATASPGFGEATFWGPALTGDYTAAYGGTLSADLKVDTAWGTDFFPYITIGDTLHDGVKCAFSTSAVPADGFYHRLTATLNEAVNPACTWEDGNGHPVSAAEFKTILQHLSVILVSADTTPATGDEAFMDNVRLIGPPETTITSAPTGIVTTSSTTVAFASDPATGTHFECQLDGGAFAACTSPATLTGLADGAHTFTVRSLIDTLADPTPASTVFAIDTRPLTIAPPPAAPAAPSPAVKPKLENVSLSGATILFTASSTGTLSVTIARKTAGHKKKGKHCSSLTRHGTACTYYKTVFHTTHSAQTGAGHLAFGRNALKKGSYRVTVTLKSGKLVSKAIAKTFTVK